jgi:NADH-quinone oxidoreductase subunit F
MNEFETRRTVRFCHGSSCNSGQAVKSRELLEKEIAKLGIGDVAVDFSGCHGFCQQGPIVIIEPDGTFYTHVKPEDIPEIARSLMPEGQPVTRLFYKDPASGAPVRYYKDIGFYAKQQRLILRNLGRINPERIDDYISVGGYEALKKALKMGPEAVIEEIMDSGLRGRGGSGFPTGLKWEICRHSPGTPKSLICNANAFMDRGILEGDPFAVVEGMTIAAYSVGASLGYIYIREGQRLAVKRMRNAVFRAREHGYLGGGITGTPFSFYISVVEGAGAFICGEETAQIASIEGKRGMPRPRPPYPSEDGLWGKPSTTDNVKTLVSVPLIISRGAAWYSGIGAKNARGTAVVSLVGKIENSGLVEVPMGTPLQNVIFDIGGGIPKGKRFKAVQVGGPSGGFLPARDLDYTLDYESMVSAGSFMGSGVMTVMDEDSCMVDMARYFMSLAQSESCGKCTPCRAGTVQMLSILTRITRGEGHEGDIDLLLSLGTSVKAASLCGLGQGAPNPVLTTIACFRDEYEEHIRDRHCRAAVCDRLASAPCNSACPAGIDVPRYVRLVGQGNPAEALDVIRERIPFPSVCGIVCVHPCQAKCRRGQVDEPIAIRELKRYAVEHGDPTWKTRACNLPASGKRVAVIGAGPAGLTCAYYLTRLGHEVTVCESSPQPGGMMQQTIPDYRLAKDILQKDIAEILALGVELKTGVRIKSIEELQVMGFQAIFVAVGSHAPTPLGITGEDSPNYMDGLTFLRSVNSGRPRAVGRRVAVIGGGNSAIDVARTALRLGAAEASLVYRRTRAEMPAASEELEDALEEGVRIIELAMPLGISDRGGQAILKCQRMVAGPVDATGRRRALPVEGVTFELEFDTIVGASGQRLDVERSFGMPLTKSNTLEANRHTLSTPVPGVFAGGDAVRGPSSIIEAIADGRLAAQSIDRFLGGKGDISERLAGPPEVGIVSEPRTGNSVPLPTIAVEERLRGFGPVELGYTPEQAREEAGRCLHCDLEERE